MPTTLPRSQVNHTGPVQHALEVAAKEWPHDASKPAALLSRLAVQAAENIETAQAARRAERLEAIRSRAGRFHGVYGANYLAEVREGWNE